MSKFTEQEKHDVIAVCYEHLSRNNYDVEKAKRELKNSVRQADEVSDKEGTYRFLAKGIDIIARHVRGHTY